eukprot:137193_1
MITKVVVSLVAIVCVLLQFAFNICYHIYDDDHSKKWANHVYYWLGLINLLITCIGLCVSIIKQRHHFHDDNTLDTMQSFTTNVILIFMVSLYFSVLATLGLIGSYSEANNKMQFLYNGGMVIGILLIAAHFVGGLKWAMVRSHNSYDAMSANWWCCLYLILTFAAHMELVAVQPWIAQDFFVEINHDIQHRTGEFVNVLIMYGCRPALTILLFRCIEQIMHQMGHYNNHHTTSGHSNDNNYVPPHTDEQTKSIQMNEMHDSCVDYQQLTDSDHNRNKSISVTGKEILFPHVTATESIAFFAFILFVMVWDIMSLGQDGNSKGYKFDFLGWCMIYILQFLWSIYVCYQIKQAKLNDINIRNVLTKHLSLFISATGLILANIGQFGVHLGTWQVLLAQVFDSFSIITICVTLVIINHAKIKQNEFLNGIKYKWLITSFGKTVIVIHSMLIVHDFLGEAFHLEHTLHSQFEEHEANKTVFGAMEFILFFWGIEFHLACIERIQMQKNVELNIIQSMIDSNKFNSIKNELQIYKETMIKNN